jgi:hypothetical protein
MRLALLSFRDAMVTSPCGIRLRVAARNSDIWESRLELASLPDLRQFNQEPDGNAIRGSINPRASPPV